MTPSRVERLRYPAGVFAAAVIVFCALLALHAYKGGVLTDFKAFYCAGTTFAHGGDPYRLGAMRSCEAGLGAAVFAGAGFDQPTIPVPWAPYAMPLLALISMLPFGVAAVAWTLVDFACLAIAAELIRRALPERAPIAIAAAVVCAGVPTEAALGQPVGIALLAVAAAGSFVRTRSIAGVAVALFASAIQPYVALPLAIALLFAHNAARLGVAICAAVIALGSALFAFDLTREYLFVVASKHTAANVLEVTQLSLTSALAAAGVSSAIARSCGSAAYVLAIVAGVWAGRRIAVTRARPEALPWIATMMATLAAPYLHFQQLASALPGALAILAIAPAGWLAESAVLGLFVPWIGLLLQTVYSYTIAPFAALMLWGTSAARRVPRLIAGAGALFAIDLALSGYARLHVVNPHGFHLAGAAADSFVDDAWASFVAVIWSSLGVAVAPARVLILTCAFALAATTLAAAARVDLRRNA